MRASGEEVELVLSQATLMTSDEDSNQPCTSYQNGYVRKINCCDASFLLIVSFMNYITTTLFLFKVNETC